MLGLFGLFAACYRPDLTGEVACEITCVAACPGDLVCRGGLCEPRDGSCARDSGVTFDGLEPDAPGPMTLCTMPTTLLADQELAGVTGEWFVAAVSPASYAVKFRLAVGEAGQVIGVIEGTRGAITGPYTTVIADDTSVSHRAPRLARDGVELFVRSESSDVAITRFSRTAGTDTWSVLSKLTLNGLSPALTTVDDPSVPTQTTPRRMVLSRVSGFVELEEEVPTIWKVIRTQNATSYQSPASIAVSFAGQASLTADGRRLIFRGRAANEPLNGAWYLERASLDVPFVDPARKLPASNSVAHPFLSTDCKQLFYDEPSSSQIRRVSYP